MPSPTLLVRFLILHIVFVLLTFPQVVSADKKITLPNSLSLNIPKGIKVTLFARDVPQARHMAFDDQGILFLSQGKKGKVVALPDLDKDGHSDKKVLIIADRRAPHGLAFAKIEENYYLFLLHFLNLRRIPECFL